MNILEYAKGVERLVNPMEVGKVLFMQTKMSKRAFLTLEISLFTLVVTDEMYNLMASKFFDWPDAMDFYRNIGWEYLT